VKLRASGLAILVGVLTLAAIALSAWQGQRSRTVMREQVLAQAEQRSLQLVDAMAGQIESLFAHIDVGLLHLRSDWHGDAARFDAHVRAELATLPAGAVTHVTVVDAGGYTAYDSLGLAERIYVGDRPHIVAHQSGGDRLVIGPPVQSRLAHTWTVVLTRPLLRDGRHAGAIAASVSVAYLADRLAALRGSGRDIVALLDADGRIIARSADPTQSIGQTLPADRPFLADRSVDYGSYRVASAVDGIARLYAWRRLPGSGVIAIIGITEASVLAPLDDALARDRVFGAAFAALLALFGIGIALLLLRLAREQRVTAASQAFRQRLFESSHVAIAVVDERARFIDCNPAAAALYGWDGPAALIGRRGLDVSAPVQADGTPSTQAAHTARALAEGSAVFEWRHRRPDGEIWDGQVHMMRFESEGRQLLQCTIEDITERKRAQQALDTVQTRYALAARVGRSAAWEIRPVERRIYFDANLPWLIGYGEQELSENLDDWFRLVPHADRQRVAEALQAVAEGRSDHYAVEHTVRRKDGTIGWIFMQGERVSAPGETPMRMVGSSVDVTERKRADRALRLLQFAVDNTRDEFVSLDNSGRVMGANKQLCASLGMTHEELLASHVWDFDPDFGLPQVAELRAKLMRDGWALFESRHRRKDGSIYPVEVSSNLIHFDGEDYTIGFSRDITQRKQAEKQLVRENEELEQRVQQRTAELLAAKTEAERANHAKSEFLSRMSHELRTPLNAILGFGQLIALESRGSETRTAVQVREILHAGRHLLDLINEVLDLARVESGALTVSPEPVALQPMLLDCLALLRPQAMTQAVVLPAGVPACDDVQVRADRTRLKQVLLNLLSNAVKYNRRDGGVDIVCTVENGDGPRWLRIGVRDDGPGLTAEQRARLFTPFERLDADERRIEGTGIGLALSKRLVEMMCGEIGVDSVPGAGSTFWVRLPLSDPAPAPVPAPASTGATAAPSAAPRADADAAVRHDVLCIEDNPANLRLVESVFAQRADVRLLTAIAPGLGLELARTRRPALVLLDINLPDMDGWAVMRCLREHEATRDIPVVAVTANATPADIERGKAAGFADYLTKPLDVNRLVAVVDAVLARRRAGRRA
jgi:PAS domain S-box-containing protein